MKRRILVLRSELPASRLRVARFGGRRKVAAASAEQSLRTVACVFLTLLATILLSPQPTLADWGACCNFGVDCYMSEPADCIYAWLPGTDCSMCAPYGELGACCFGEGWCLLMDEWFCLMQEGNWLGHGSECSTILCPPPPPPQGACCNEMTGECRITEGWDCPDPYTWLGEGSSCGSCLKPVVIERFEINQCFQETSYTTQKYDLIETKPFVVDVNLGTELEEPIKVIVSLKISKGDTPIISKAPTEPPEENFTIEPDKQKKCVFYFNDNETRDMKAGEYKFSLVVEDTEGNKLLVPDISYTFKSSKTVRILVVEHFIVRAYNPDEHKYELWVDEDWDSYSELNSCFNFAEKVFPVPKRDRENVNHLHTKPFHWLKFDLKKITFDILVERMGGTLNSYNQAEKEREKKGEKSEPADFMCVTVPDMPMFEKLPGFASRKGRAIFLRPSKHLDPNNKTTWGEIFGHELGHLYVLGDEYVVSEVGKSGSWDIIIPWFNFDLNPPPLNRPTGKFKIIRPPYAGQRCDWPDKNPDSYGSYSQPILDKENKWWCIGRFIGEGGYDVDKNKREKDRKMPPDTLSMMGSADRTHWISGPEYKSLITALVPTAPKAAPLSETAASPTSGERMLVSGIIDIPAKTAEISPLMPVPNLELSQEASDPNCQIVFKSSTGTVLGDFNIAPLEGEDPNSWLEGPFCVVVDIPTDTARIDVNICGVVADELQLTENSPTVTVLSPNGSEQISGEMVITWSASDADINDTNNLSYTVEFSHDNGTEWSALAIDLDSNELTVDSNYLPGGPNCLVKVIASDGWNLAEDVSNSVFSIPTKPPRVTILDPEDGTILLSSESMQGRCIAYDPETGDVNDPNAIVWSSSIDGFLGKGDLVGFQLSVGEHLLSATATDPEAKTGIDTVSVKVLANASDFNCDNHVDFFDLVKFAQKWQATCSAFNWCEGTDLDRSGVVDYDDLAELAENWLWQAVP